MAITLFKVYHCILLVNVRGTDYHIQAFTLFSYPSSLFSEVLIRVVISSDRWQTTTNLNVAWITRCPVKGAGTLTPFIGRALFIGTANKRNFKIKVKSHPHFGHKFDERKYVYKLIVYYCSSYLYVNLTRWVHRWIV